MRRLLLTAAAVLLLTYPAAGDDLRLRLSDRLADVRIDDDNRVVVRTEAGSERVMSPTEFVDHLADRQRAGRERGTLFRLLDITSPLGLVWVAVGFGGQFVFAGRMIVQWLVSEKARRSVVPPAFWWMSLVGSSMLMAYFVWRWDVVGVLGQGMGWVIYVRNLWMIHRPRPLTADGPVPPVV